MCVCVLRGAMGADQPMRRDVVFLHNRSHSCPFCVCHVEGARESCYLRRGARASLFCYVIYVLGYFGGEF